MELPSISLSDVNRAPANTGTADFGSLTSQDFFKLIITDLLNQDPLQPMDNEQLLEQIATIRNIEMNNEVTSTMRSLVGEQRFGSAATLIGQLVEGSTAHGMVGGMVAGVRFDEGGAPIMILDGGRELPMSSIQSVTSMAQLRESLIGMLVTAQVSQDDTVKQIEGLVTGVEQAFGRIMLELDSGEEVPLDNVIDRRSPSVL